MLASKLRAFHLHLGMTGAAIGAACTLLGRAARIWLRGGEQRGKRLATLIATTEGQRLLFTVLRAVRPNLLLRRRLVTAYPNTGTGTGTAIVSRATDVAEVLSPATDFAVVYEPRMRAITGGANF